MLGKNQRSSRPRMGDIIVSKRWQWTRKDGPTSFARWSEEKLFSPRLNFFETSSTNAHSRFSHPWGTIYAMAIGTSSHIFHKIASSLIFFVMLS